MTVHDYGRTAQGSFYFAMELLDGMDLEKLVASNGPQPPERVIHIVRQVARGLHEAHDVGLVHRDIKPANVFVCRRWGEPDAVKVLDFGLAKNHADPRAAVTAHDVVLGTPLYISPEALNGATPVDVRSDIYSLGAVAYYMLTGEPVFTGGSLVEVCARHLHSTPVAPSERVGHPVPADLEAIVLSCLAKPAGDRYATAAELERALAACGAANEWSAEHARDWWRLHGSASTPAREQTGAGRTVEIDPSTRVRRSSPMRPRYPSYYGASRRLRADNYRDLSAVTSSFDPVSTRQTNSLHSMQQELAGRSRWLS